MRSTGKEVIFTSSAVFAVNGSRSLHKLELSKTLLRFVEFDFTYFWEQCIEAGRNARKTGRISKNLENMAINSLVKCHPYVEACSFSEFSSVVIDCIIAYICHSEGIGLEELWARCISPKSLYEKAIFNRVSEYKTGRGINQWINIVRMQEYARSKLKFIYECDANIMLRPEEYRTRMEYFDLAFSVAANETGCPTDKLPSVRMYTPAQLPDAVFMMGRVSKNIYRRLSDVLGNAEMWEEKQLNDHNRDQTALDAFSYVKDMPRPGDNDMKFALEAVMSSAETVYVPDSFKALIDLEFTLMCREGIYMSKCPRCGRFFVRDADEKSPYCRRVNSSGKTCFEQINEEFGLIRKQENVPRKENSVPEQEKEIPETDDITAALNEAAADINSADENTAEQPPEPAQTVQSVVYEQIALPDFTMETEQTEASGQDEAAEKKPEEAPPEKPAPKSVRQAILEMEPPYTPTEVPKELEKRGQRIYNMLYKRIGSLMTEREFREWSGYLSDTKRDIREGNAEISQMEEFLDYWETAIKKQTRRSRRKKGEPVPFEPPVIVREKPSNEYSSMFDEAVEAAERKEDSGISPAGTEAAPEERRFKPFEPPKYSTVLEAMNDGKYKSEELLRKDGGDTDDITVDGRRITLPNWERITRN